MHHLIQTDDNLLGGNAVVSKGSDSHDEALAKKIYLDHRGNGFFMWKNDIYDTYREYGIAREKEVGWAKEEIERLLKVFTEDGPGSDNIYRGLIDFISVANDVEGLRILLHLVRSKMANLDTFTLVLIAEATLKLLRASGRSEALGQRDLLEAEFVLIKDLLERANTMNLFVAPEFFKDGGLMFMSGGLSEEYIRERINSDIRELESYSFPWDDKGRLWKWLQSKIPWPKKL
ncbi:MAG: hypothetical protein JNK74_02120 [Candidatus Hydrogenedentes bacterium]|nr:hypothetical protein [Candidatus Hydrogenedentota bacterium]